MAFHLPAFIYIHTFRNIFFDSLVYFRRVMIPDE